MRFWGVLDARVVPDSMLAMPDDLLLHEFLVLMAASQPPVGAGNDIGFCFACAGPAASEELAPTDLFAYVAASRKANRINLILPGSGAGLSARGQAAHPHLTHIALLCILSIAAICQRIQSQTPSKLLQETHCSATAHLLASSPGHSCSLTRQMVSMQRQRLALMDLIVITMVAEDPSLVSHMLAMMRGSLSLKSLHQTSGRQGLDGGNLPGLKV